MPQVTSANDGHALYDYFFNSNMYSSRFLHLFPTNPYHNPTTTLPQPVAHKVWIIDCKSCGSFLTNRGMKAVLLLRPNVPLYSSDALPVNCSAYTSNPEALKPATFCRPPAHSSRTCECLTQTLCCHGCGSTIGYMIVVPCIRCTSSISTTNRATNGHRFVFHSSEVIGTERHYVPDEPGVIPFEPVPVTISPPAPYLPHFQNGDPGHAPLRDLYPHLSQVAPNEYLPTPPLDMADLSPVSSTSSSPVAESFSFSQGTHSDQSSAIRTATAITERLVQSSTLVPSQSVRSPSASRQSSSGSDMSSDVIPPPMMSASSSPFSFGMPSEHFEQPLKAGDLLFWHHLSRHGEIPGVTDDPRARKGNFKTEDQEECLRKSTVFDR